MNYQQKNSFDEPARIIRRAGVPDDDLYIPSSVGDAVSHFFRSRFSKEAFRRFAKKNFPAKGDEAGEKIRKSLRVLAFLVLTGALIYLGIYYVNYRERANQTNDLGLLLEEYSDDMTDAEKASAWNSIKKLYPSVAFPAGMNLRFANLYAINQDTRGMLTIPNTNISTVLMQNEDSDYYLYTDMYGETSRYGQPFIEPTCKISADGNSKNIIIYGHNTHDKLMFHQLTNYMSVEGYQRAPVIILETLYEKAYYKIFAVMLTNSTSDADNGHVFNYLYPDFNSDSEFMALMNEVYARSMIHTGIDVEPTDQIITLYTCYQNIFDGGRLVIFGRKVREGESSVVDTSGAYYDNNAIFPQAYYDKLGY